MKHRGSVLFLAILAAFMFAGCSRRPVETTPQPTQSTQVPNDANQGGGAGGTSDENNDGKPDSTPDPSERVEDGMDKIEDDVENGVEDVKEGVENGINDAKRGIENAADGVKDEMNRIKEDATGSSK